MTIRLFAKRPGPERASGARFSGLLVAGLLVSACAETPKAPAPAPGGAARSTPPRDTAIVAPEALRVAGLEIRPSQRVAWRDTWQVSARLVLDPASTQAIGSLVEGRVTQVLVQAGDRVRRGQVLVTIHSHELLDAYNALAQTTAGRAEADNAAQLAAATTARSERLYAVRAGSLADLERARAARVASEAGQHRATAELARAREMVSHLRPSGAVPTGVDPGDVLVRAPFDGIIVAREAQPGSVVAPGASLITVSRVGSLLVAMRLPEAALGAARIGSDVQFTVPAYPERLFTGRVTHVTPTLDSLSRTAEVFAAVDNRAGELRAQMTVAAAVMGPPRDQVVVVPIDAVQDFEGDTIVVTSSPHGAGLRLEAVRVRVGRRAAGLAEVVAGLAPGTAVVGGGAAVAKAEILRQRDARGGGAGGSSQ